VANTHHAKQGGKKQWRTPKQAREGHTLPPAIEAGDSGIWATCELNKEAKCVGELKDLFYRVCYSRPIAVAGRSGRS